MKKNLLILVLLPILALSSCQKSQTDSVNDSNTIELRFVDTYNSASSVATRATLAAEGYEKTVTSLVLLAYSTSAMNNDAPLIKYVFSDNEREKLRAVIPLGTVTPGAKLYFYVVANASDKYPVLASNVAEPTIKDLLALLEDKSLNTYNKGTFDLFAKEGVNQIGGSAKGFVMSDKQEVTIQPAGSGTPTKVNMMLNRTVARIDVNAKLTDVFKANYPDAILKIKSATIKYEGKQGLIIPKVETMAESIANASLAKDSLVQSNYSTTQTAEGKFRYYPYPCFDRNATALDFGTGSGTIPYNPANHKHMLLTIVAEFSYEEGKMKTINYKIPLTGTDKKGGFIRNYLYNIQVNIDGLTDQEIKAKIEMADWEVAVTQTVNIGG